MHCNRPMPTPKPNAHKKKDPSRSGNPVSKYGDKHGMERHKMPLPPKSKRGEKADWS